MTLPIVDDWKNAGSWWTVRLGAAYAAWGALPPESQAATLAFFGIPQERLASIVGVIVVLVRLYKQRKMVPAEFQDTEQVRR